MRNRIIHGYDMLDDEVIWDVVATNLPPLEALLALLLDENGDEIAGDLSD